MRHRHAARRAARLYAVAAPGLGSNEKIADGPGGTGMLLNRSEISADKSFNLLTESILDRDQAKTTDIFFKMVQSGQSIGDALSIVTAAEAPFVNVPCHINIKDGNIALTNNDHTLLGLRASTYLMPYLPEKYRLLPLLQSVWYIGAGLDIWNQLLYKYPGRYATMKGVTVPPPDYGPAVWLEDMAPIVEKGTLEERLHSYMIATMTGDSRRAHGLFLGLAQDLETRAALHETIEFLGLIDIQETVIGRKARNTGHKAIRARAVTDLADYIGWEKSHGVFYMGVPDMAVGPLYYSLYDAASVLIAAEFEDAGKGLEEKNQTPLSRSEVENLIQHLMLASGEAAWNLLTAHLKNGKSIQSIGDTIQLGAAELILRTTVARQFTNGQHPFDYCNVANNWMRNSKSPYKARILYLMANFINDVAHENKLVNSIIEDEIAGYDGHGRTPQALLAELDDAIMALDAPRATAAAHAYLKSGADRRPYMETVALCASRFQDDPHNQKITVSTFEEYGLNSTHLKDRLLLATPRLLAGWVKMPGERECYARFEKEWIYN
jgi:hypothetical protein